MSIGAALIVRDEAACLRECLVSLQGVVDETVVVDTGSKDDTMSIAREYADRLYSFAWIDDFGAARNYSLDRISADYVLILDADNQIVNPHEARALLDTFAGRHDESVVGTVEITNTLGDGPESNVVAESAQRFFRRGVFRYSGAIHEQLSPVGAGRHSVAPTGVRYTHSGYAHAVTSPRHKAHRNKRMLENELGKCPGDEYYLYQLGKAHFSLAEYGPAVEVFTRALYAMRFEPGRRARGRTGSPVADDVLTDLIVSLAYAYVNTGRLGEARTLLESQRALGHPGTRAADFPHALGYVYLMEGDIPRARQAYEESLRQGPGREFVRGTGSYSSLFHLGLLSEAEQDLAAALKYYVASLRVKPDYHAALSRCIDLIVEYRVALPPAVWDTADHEAFETLYTKKLAEFLKRGAVEPAGLLLQAAAAISPRLSEACIAQSSGKHTPCERKPDAS